MEDSKEVFEAFECPVCLNIPSLENKPLGLPCGHTICSDCVKDLIGRASRVDPGSWGFECPVCRKNCDVPLDQLNTNIQVLSAIQILEAARHKKIPPTTASPTGATPRGAKSDDSDTKPLPMTSEKPVQFKPLVPGGHRNLETKVLKNQNATEMATIPGNWSTNPFMNDLKKSPVGSPSPELPPRPHVKPATVPALPKRPVPPRPPTVQAPMLPPPKATPSQLYVALYDYVPQRPDELALKKGEIYEVTSKNADYWFKGTCKRTLKSGMMPGNFLQLAVKGTTPMSKPASATPKDLTRNLIDLDLGAPKPQGLGRFVAIDQYPADNDDELNLQRGDEIIMFEKRKDGWCSGKVIKSGKQGLFPLSFVTKKM